MKSVLYRLCLLGMALALAFSAWGVMPVEKATADSIVFTESMGSGTCNKSSGPLTIAVYESNNCYDNDAFTMNGTAQMRMTSPSNGYSGASGEWNVLITNIAGRYFEIADIDTTDYQSLVLAFGVFKNTTTSNGSDLSIQVSADGVNWTALTMRELPTGAGTADTWHYRTLTGAIPATQNLRIRFTNTATTTQFRIDDVRLFGNPTAVTLTDFSAAWQGDIVRVTWETAQELDNLGFNLYRSDAAAGPWVKLNDTLIPSQNPGAVFGAVYEWLDADVTPGAIYFYRLEDVDIAFVSTFHGPVSTAPGAAPSAVSLAAFGSRTVGHVGVLLGVVAAAALLCKRRSLNA